MPEIVKFPAAKQRSLRNRLAIDGRNRLAELDEQLRTLNQAITTLTRKRTGLLAQYRAEFERQLRKGTGS